MATAEGWAQLSDDELYHRLTQRGMTAAQAAWVLNNRDDPEAMACVARVMGS